VLHELLDHRWQVIAVVCDCNLAEVWVEVIAVITVQELLIKLDVSRMFDLLLGLPHESLELFSFLLFHLQDRFQVTALD
jgi:ATP/ADP translocase